MPPRPSLTPADQAGFDELQKKLVALWRMIATHSTDEQSVVVVPSLSMDLELVPAVAQAYEERMLFLLLLLRLPRLRMIFVTSQAILPETIDYYLGLLSGVVPSHARARLFLVATLDGTPRPLTAKLLERDRLLARIRGLIPNSDTCHLIAFNTTELEKELALRLGIPLYGADPKFAPLGTKTGGRRLFAETGVPHPAGAAGIRSLDDLAKAAERLRAERPGIQQAIVKLDEGVSGWGNAVLDLDGSGPLGDAVRRLRFEGEGQTLDAYVASLAQQGGIVEERLVGDEFRSPSVQMRATPLGEIEVLSTHDQLLGGPSGMSFLGAVFPADPAYAVEITRHARKVGERLAKEGVLGRFAIDFVSVRRSSTWHSYAIELNLRKGGTTAPFLTLEYLTQGRYDADAGRFLTRLGEPKCYVATDYVQSETYKGLAPIDLFDLAIRHELHFNVATQKGVVFHMLAALSEAGRFGLTAVGNSPEEAKVIYDRMLKALDDEA